MLVFEIVRYIAAAYGIYEFLFIRLEVHSWLKSKLKGELSFSTRRVEREVVRISKKIRKGDFRPDKIVACGGGTSMGGCIVGAFLASRKYLDRPFLMIEFDRPSYVPVPGSLNYVVEQLKGSDQILLVDDVSKRGDTIGNAMSELERFGIDRGNIRAAVIVRYAPELVQKEFDGSLPVLDRRFWRNNYCNLVTQMPVEFPWHV